MKFLGNLLLAAAAGLIWPCSSLPSDQGDRSGFSVTQVGRGHQLRSGLRDKAKTFMRYTKLRGSSPGPNSQIGRVPAWELKDDSSYVCPVQVGGQTLHLDFDTGSSDLWVFSSLLPAQEAKNHRVYDPSKSKSARLETGLTWNITYGDESNALGVVYQDRVCVGGATVVDQAVEAATSVTSDFSNSSRDGILGLAFDPINAVQPTKVKTFFSNVLSSLATKVFTACLRHKQPGTYDFGFVDHEKYVGRLSYVPVDASKGVWQFNSSGWAVGRGDSLSASSAIGVTFADTGSSLMYLPTEVIMEYYKQVEATEYDNDQQSYVVPCKATLPDLKLELGESTIVVPGQNVNYGPIDKHGALCLGGLQESPAPGISIFGDVFFQSAFVV
ncbi:MAG: hypothetical protein FE78DRAFT_536032, partial [Acidomyces sp. 'richmondensis']